MRHAGFVINLPNWSDLLSAFTFPPMTTRKSSKVDDYDDAKPYVIGTEIGKGSFATVYKGYHESTRQQVAIKTVTRDKLSPKLVENLQSEIQILKLLSHRHITKLIEIVHAEHYIYLVMEFCSGGDLTNYIKKRGRVESLEYIPSPGAAPRYYPHPATGGLDEIVVRSFLRQLARALKFLRHRNLIHRDIKPQNLLLSPPPLPSSELSLRGHPPGVPILKIADFGFARSLPSTMLAETLCGSPLYMAPEILGYKKYDAKADLWSVGAVLYEMAVGKPPFRAQNHIELLKRIERTKEVRFPDEESSHHKTNSTPNGTPSTPQIVPSDIKKLIRMLLKQKPAERASFEEFFSSTALARSKFPRPRDVDPTSTSGTPSSTSTGAKNKNATSGGVTTLIHDPINNVYRPLTPPGHRIIPDEVLDERVLVPGGRRWDWGGGHPREGEAQTPGAGPSQLGNQNQNQTPQLKTSGVGIGSEYDYDYVLVGDTRAVEFNRAVDELALASAPRPRPRPRLSERERRPLQERERESLQRRVSSEEEDPDPMILPMTTTTTANVNNTTNTTTNTTNTKAIPVPVPVPTTTTPTTITFPPPPLPPHGTPPQLSSPPRAQLLEQHPTLKSCLGRRGVRIEWVWVGEWGKGKGKGKGKEQGNNIPVHHQACSIRRGPESESKSKSKRPLEIETPVKYLKLKPQPQRRRQKPTPTPIPTPTSIPNQPTPNQPTPIPNQPTHPPIEKNPIPSILLLDLENLAQKTDVLCRWADEMFEFVRGVRGELGGLGEPSQTQLELIPIPNPTLLKHHPHQLEPHQPQLEPTNSNPTNSNPNPASSPKALKAAKKRFHASLEAEYNAVTCIAVYILLMGFAQKGIDRLRDYHERLREHWKMRFPEGEGGGWGVLAGWQGWGGWGWQGWGGAGLAVAGWGLGGEEEEVEEEEEEEEGWEDFDFGVSEGFDDALQWFKEMFIKCNERAALVKTWLPAKYEGPKSWLDQLVYDRALLLSRTAARKELLDQASSPDECEKLYEESLWCLYALQDDLLQTGNPFSGEDKKTIATWIKRTKLRLHRCRTRMAMNDVDRLADARADHNLVDVVRIPAPWDVKPTAATTTTTTATAMGMGTGTGMAAGATATATGVGGMSPRRTSS
ncbi:hypothetical protein D9758_011942 [Tetrapyrgos nigripes]|uniref:non-specific serine/threonine protein kinase n=1 Tax=Tetrapyrgos nigripes TaxID=182062 RepID=A0A8H5D265_9AGAR|nr:hypothetical protein D9758_011942 [Tetrapyrgos nigripes]